MENCIIMYVNIIDKNVNWKRHINQLRAFLNIENENKYVPDCFEKIDEQISFNEVKKDFENNKMSNTVNLQTENQQNTEIQNNIPKYNLRSKLKQ